MSLGKRRAQHLRTAHSGQRRPLCFVLGTAACRTQCPGIQVLPPALSVRLARHLTSLRAD